MLSWTHRRGRTHDGILDRSYVLRRGPVSRFGACVDVGVVTLGRNSKVLEQTRLSDLALNTLNTGVDCSAALWLRRLYVCPQ